MTQKLNAEEILIVDDKRVENVVAEEDDQVVAARAANGAAGAAAVSTEQDHLLLKDTVTEEDKVEEVILARRRKKHWFLLPLLLALLLILVLGGSAFASTSATITLVLEQHSLVETVSVLHNADLIAASGKLIQSVPPSIITVPGQHAYGYLTFHSAITGCGCASVVPAGTVFRGADGVAVMTESAAILGPNCTVTVPAESLVSGPVGDIRAHDVQAMYSKGISVWNSYAFSGGTNGYSYPVVLQSSIDAVAHKLTAQLKPSVMSALDTRAKQAGLTLLAKSCISSTSTRNATVAVSMTCSAPAYNAQAVKAQAVQQAIQLLTKQAKAAFGSDYTRTRQAVDNVTLTVLVDHNKATVQAIATAEGQWTYQLNNVQRQEIQHMLAGKDLDDAIAFLHEERGIQSFHIDRYSFVPKMLPVLADHIKLVAQA